MKSSTASRMIYDQGLLTQDDLFLFNEGSHFRLYEKLGAHLWTVNGEAGTIFSVWAPNAKEVYVIGEFNGWNKKSHPLCPRGQSGIWEGFIPGIGKGALYKYFIVSHHHGYKIQKADPYATFYEVPPKTASVVWDLAYEWKDQAWMASRGRHHQLNAPLAIYEVHLGSWMRVPEENHRPLTYREAAPKLVEYVS
ncbi:MAG: 1,4-alpha-glucan branching enzyme, partial [Candidatus Omnitrophota bacterium]